VAVLVLLMVAVVMVLPHQFQVQTLPISLLLGAVVAEPSILTELVLVVVLPEVLGKMMELIPQEQQIKVMLVVVAETLLVAGEVVLVK
jgi:hypothetical protein